MPYLTPRYFKSFQLEFAISRGRGNSSPRNMPRRNTGLVTINYLAYPQLNSEV